MSPIAPTLESFFAERLLNQRRVSPRTIASYRDSLKLLLTFALDLAGVELLVAADTSALPSAAPLFD